MEEKVTEIFEVNGKWEPSQSLGIGDNSPKAFANDASQ